MIRQTDAALSAPGLTARVQSPTEISWIVSAVRQTDGEQHRDLVNEKTDDSESAEIAETESAQPNKGTKETNKTPNESSPPGRDGVAPYS